MTPRRFTMPQASMTSWVDEAGVTHWIYRGPYSFDEAWPWWRPHSPRELPHEQKEPSDV